MQVDLSSFGVLQIEPTDHCNLHCRMCQPHFTRQEQIHGVPKGLLDMGLYRRLLDGLVADDCRFDHVIFQWLGDPSLHPALETMVALAQERLVGRVNYLRVDTNAIRLAPHRMDRLVEAWSRNPTLPLLLVFTIDAVTPATYAHVKGQPAMERVRRNVRHFIRRRAELPQADVRLNVQLQFVLQPGNAHEARPFIEEWSEFLRREGRGKGYSEIMIKRLSLDAGGQGQLEADLLYERSCREQAIDAATLPHVEVKVWRDRPWESTAHLPRPDEAARAGRREAPAQPFRQPCPGLWMTPVIRHDGHLMMCCADLEGHLDLGDLRHASFRELWEGPEAVRRRLAHVRGAFHEVGPCESCGGINWYRTPPEVVQAWLGGVGRSDLWRGYAARAGV